MRQCHKLNVEKMALKEATVSGQVLTTLGGLAKTPSLIVGLTPRRERVLTDFNRKEERRNRFLRKKKFKNISSSSNLKVTGRKELTINLYKEIAHAKIK